MPRYAPGPASYGKHSILFGGSNQIIITSYKMDRPQSSRRSPSDVARPKRQPIGVIPIAKSGRPNDLIESPKICTASRAECIRNSLAVFSSAGSREFALARVFRALCRVG